MGGGGGGGAGPTGPFPGTANDLYTIMLVVPYMHSFNMCTFEFENNVCQFEADFCRELGSKSLYPTALTFRLISIP